MHALVVMKNQNCAQKSLDALVQAGHGRLALMAHDDLHSIGNSAWIIILLTIAIEATGVHGLDAKIYRQAKVCRLAVTGVDPAKSGFPRYKRPLRHTNTLALFIFNFTEMFIVVLSAPTDISRIEPNSEEYFQIF